MAPHLDMTEDDVCLAYAFSKKLQVDELGQWRAGYEIMSMVEFYEFIVRLGDIKFKTQKPL